MSMKKTFEMYLVASPVGYKMDEDSPSYYMRLSSYEPTSGSSEFVIRKVNVTVDVPDNEAYLADLEVGHLKQMKDFFIKESTERLQKVDERINELLAIEFVDSEEV